VPSPVYSGEPNLRWDDTNNRLAIIMRF
jgi:hypothetical protein